MKINGINGTNTQMGQMGVSAEIIAVMLAWESPALLLPDLPPFVPPSGHYYEN